MTKVTHAEQLQLDTPANLWAYFGNTGVNKTVFYDSAGKLGVGGAATMGGAVAVPALTIDPNTAAVNVLGDVSIGANKLTIAAANGNTAIAGTLGVTGLSTLTGGFTLGADSSANAHKITNLTNGAAAQDAAAFGQIATAVNAAVAGTLNRVAKFTGANSVGNTAFPIDDAAGTLTLGDNTASDAITINGRITGVSTDSTTTPLSYAMIATGGVTGSRAAIRGDMTGTFDTTAGTFTVYGMWGDASATKSAGANNLVVVGTRGFASGTADDTRGMIAQSSGTGSIAYGLHATVSGTATTSRAVFAQATGAATTNIAGDFTATGGTTNIGLRTVNGDNYLNVTSGSTNIGIASGSGSITKFQVFQTSSTGHGALVTRTPTAGTTTGMATISATTNGTMDTTAGALTSNGMWSVVSTTRSAGANSLTNIAARFDSTGAQANEAIRTESGDVRLNTVGGVSTIGFSTATATALTVSGQSTFTSTLSTGNAFTASWNPSGGTTNFISAMRLSAAGTMDTTAGGLRSTGIYGSSTTTRSAGANTLTDVGVLGEVSGTAGQTNIGVWGSASSTGTTNTAVLAQATGAGTTNIGVDATATGATTNIALRTVDGSNYLNATSGNSAFGVASGTSLTNQKVRIDGASGIQSLVVQQTNTGQTVAVATLNVQTTGSWDTTAGALQINGFTSNGAATRSAGANNLTNVAGRFTTGGGGQINVALLTVSGDNYFNDTSGSTGVGVAIGGSLAAAKFNVTNTSLTIGATAFTWTPVAGTTTNIAAQTVTANGTFDTTASIITETGVNITVTGTRSAGANNLNNRALLLNASGAQTNNALTTLAGNIFLNTSSGSTGVGYAEGTALPAKISATSTGATSLGDFLLTTSGSVSTLNTVNILSNGTFDTTAGALNSRGVNASVTSTRSAGANSLANIAGQFNASGAQVNVALRTDAGDNYFNSTSGSSGVGIASGGAFSGKFHVFSSATAPAVFVNKNTSGIASSSIAIQATRDGTVDTTAGVLTSTSGSFSATSTRSGGANALTNVGILTTASGAQVNVALQTDDGNVILNNVSGTTKIGGNIGFYGTTPIAKPAAVGSRGGNAALASLLTQLASLGLVTDSTTA